MKTNTAAFFNNLAHKWDEICHHDAHKIQTLVHLVAMKSQADILDVGCGTGILESFLLEYDPKKIVAVDIAEQMICQAKKKYQDPRITFECIDVMQLENQQYDYIYLYSVFPHFTDVETLFKQLKCLLKPEGKIIICHSQSRHQINGHHAEKASDVSGLLPQAQVLATQMGQYFDIEVIIDNEAFYMVVGQNQVVV